MCYFYIHTYMCCFYMFIFIIYVLFLYVLHICLLYMCYFYMFYLSQGVLCCIQSLAVICWLHTQLVLVLCVAYKQHTRQQDVQCTLCTVRVCSEVGSVQDWLGVSPQCKFQVSLVHTSINSCYCPQPCYGGILWYNMIMNIFANNSRTWQGHCCFWQPRTAFCVLCDSFSRTTSTYHGFGTFAGPAYR